MSNILRAASLFAVIISAAGTFAAADPGFASDVVAQASAPDLQLDPTIVVDVEAETSNQQPATSEMVAPQPAIEPVVVTPPVPVMPARLSAATLSQLVAKMPQLAALDAELACLAGTIYFESKGESLEGQLAVGHVVLNRAASGRFPRTVCGVVYQRSQFSFVRGGTMPVINKSGRAWREALAIAQIAQQKLWEAPAKGALFFHASRVSPGWRLTRIAQIDNHIFYR